MSAPAVEECLSCRSLSGAARISPGPSIYMGQYWVVEHAYPTSHLGWLVLVLKRHCEALHDLTAEEAGELGVLQHRAARALRHTLDCRKEYIACFSEAPGFAHVHVHLVARPDDLPPDLVGPRIFARLKPAADEVVPPADIQRLCVALAQQFSTS